MKKVNVFIQNRTGSKYGIRCINYIKRQTYQNISIISNFPYYEDASVRFIDNDPQESFRDVLLQALDIMTGEYLLIIDPDLVLEEDCIESLVECKPDDGISTVEEFCTSDEKKRTELHASVYVKLFDLDKVKSLLCSCDNLSEQTFVDKYLSDTVKCLRSENKFCYCEEDSTDLIKLDERDPGYIESTWVKSLRIWDSNVSSCIIDAFLPMYKSDSNNYRKTLDLIIEEIIDNKRMTYGLSKKYISEIYKEAVNGSSDAYLYCRAFFSRFADSSDMLKVMLASCSLTEEHFAYMEKYEQLEDYLFYIDSIRNQNDFEKVYSELKSLKESIMRIDSDVKKNRTALSRIQTGVETGIYKNTRGMSGSELDGYQFSELMISSYRNGKLGLKSIFKSLAAWIKYKIKGAA